MNELMRIENFDISVKEYNGRRVVTFKDIDMVHERPDGTARKRFNDNKKHFVEKEDYFVLNQPSEIRTLGLERPQGGVPEKVTLITEQGYLMLVKSFTDDLAWTVQRQLVNKYFKTEDNFSRKELSPTLQIVYALADNSAKIELEQKRQAEKLATLESNQKAINTAMLGQREESFRGWVNRCLSAIAESSNYQYIGGREERHRAVRAESYERLNQKKPCRLKQRVESEKGRAAIAGASAARIKEITKLSVIESDKALKPLYEAVIREMMIAYCVEVA